MGSVKDLKLIKEPAPVLLYSIVEAPSFPITILEGDEEKPIERLGLGDFVFSDRKSVK
jgi:hypothetical protein